METEAYKLLMETVAYYFFYFNSLSSWKWTFPEGLGGFCHTCGNSEGVEGHQFPAKMENPGRWGGLKWNSLRGGGLDIFWNYLFLKKAIKIQLIHLYYQIFKSLILGQQGLAAIFFGKN